MILDILLLVFEPFFLYVHNITLSNKKFVNIRNNVRKVIKQYLTYQFSSVAKLCPTLCDPMYWVTRPPHPSLTPRVYSNSSPLSWWCHPAISSSVVPFSSYPESLPASGSFLMSQFFASGGQSMGLSASASVLPWISSEEKKLKFYITFSFCLCNSACPL